MWKDIFNFNLNFIVIISGLLYLKLFVTCEPVCYARTSQDERNSQVKMVDCDGSDDICMQFASREDVNVGQLLNSACAYPEDNPVTHEKYTKVTCSTTNLPTVTNGSFDCAPKSEVPKGKACNLTCKDGFYPAYSNQTVCEAGISDQGKEWSKENFECRAITCSTTNLPTVTNGSFDCAINSSVSKGEVCTLTCNNELYPAYSDQAVCEAGTSNQGGVWSDGSFVCRSLECNGWNQWNGSEYKFISTWQTWNESRQLCESSSSHLVTIENKEENEFIYKMMLHCYSFKHAWIGLNDIDAEGTWEWSDGTVSTYRNWGGEPQDGEYCAYMSGNGKWYGHWCNSGQTRTVCERNNSLT